MLASPGDATLQGISLAHWSKARTFPLQAYGKSSQASHFHYTPVEVACVRAELWGAPGANLGWELGEMGGWDISPSGFSLALLPFAVGVSTVERRGCGPLAWLPVPVCVCGVAWSRPARGESSSGLTIVMAAEHMGAIEAAGACQQAARGGLHETCGRWCSWG